jgi:hypothetical protein
MSDTGALAQISQARLFLERAKDLTDIKAVRDMAEAARLYARAAGLGQDAMNEAAEIKVRAERKAGEALAAMDKAKGHRFTGDSQAESPVAPPARLADIGITPKQSMQWQAGASVPEPMFEQHIAETKAEGKPLTTAGVVQVAREIERGRGDAILERTPDPDGAHLRAKIKRAYSTAVLQVMQGFMTVDPLLTVEVLDGGARGDLQRFIGSLRARLDAWESAMQRGLHAVGE